MAANTQPVFGLTPNVNAKNTSTTSNANLTGNALSNGTGTIITAGANGTKINEVSVVATGTSLVGTVNLFLVDGSANWWLLDQVAISAQTLTTGTVQIPWSKVYDIIIPSGWTVNATQTCAGTQIACTVTVFAEDF